MESNTSELATTTPTQLGLSLQIISGPAGHVESDWPCIKYVVALRRDTSKLCEVWSGDYKIGVGHVKWPTLAQVEGAVFSFTPDETNVLRIRARGQALKETPEAMALEADVAAELARRQKVAPDLNDVVASLICDGSAHFDSHAFETWCDDFGYDTDSRKAEATFRTCDETGRKLARALTADELAGLREWASNF
jgi:hypothetical protein